MSILIRFPNWIGDAVMATPALRNLLAHHADESFVMAASPAVAGLFADDPRFTAVLADRTASSRFRPLALWRWGRELKKQYGPFSAAWSFPNGFSARWMLYAAGASQRIGRDKRWHAKLLTHRLATPAGEKHEAECYNHLLNQALGTDYSTGPTELPLAESHAFSRPTIGVNPGAAYGSAKRWPPKKFAQVAAALAADFDIAIFGGPNERQQAEEIASCLQEAGVSNFENFAGRTSIGELVAKLAALRLFITNDSGPMHIAGAFQVPTVAVFGPTNHRLTYAWGNPNARIVRRDDVECAPCMKRVCPLERRVCMEDLDASLALAAARELLGGKTPPLRRAG